MMHKTPAWKFLKQLLTVLIVGVAGLAGGAWLVGNYLQREHGEQINQLRNEWLSEKEDLEAQLAWAQKRALITSVAGTAMDNATNSSLAAKSGSLVPAAAARLPKDILAQLKSLNLKGGAGNAQSQREMVALLGELARSGAAALPAIREFLASNEYVQLGGPGKGKGNKGLVAGSLRAELFKVAAEIGGPEGEQLLAESLRGATSRDELLVLASSLEELAPGKYKDTAIAAAQEQLNALASAGQAQGKGTKPLYEVLSMYGDKSYVEQARQQVIQADGNLNKEALDYLQSSLKQENLPLLKELLQNPQVGDARQKEEIMKMVAELAGTDPQANQFWYESALNPNYPDKIREKAIKELEARGFQDRKNPTAADLQLAQSRLQLLEALRPQLQDPNQLAMVEQTRVRLAAMMDPNLRQALQGQPKAPRMK